MKKILITIFILLAVSISARVTTRTLSMETGFLLSHMESKIGLGDIGLGLYDYFQIGTNSIMDIFIIPNINVKVGGFLGDIPLSIAAGAVYWDFLGFSPILAQSTNQLLTDELTGTLKGKLYGYGFYFAASYEIAPGIASIHGNFKADKVECYMHSIGDFTLDPREYVDNTDVYLVSPVVWGEVDAWHRSFTISSDIQALSFLKLYPEIGYDMTMDKLKWGFGFGLPAGGDGEILLGVVGPGVEMDDVKTGIVPVIQATWNFYYGEDK